MDYTCIYIFFFVLPFLLDLCDFMWGEAFLLEVEQFLDQLVQWSTAVFCGCFIIKLKLLKKVLYYVDNVYQ